MRRRLFNLAAAVSLVLCMATMALWVRSYWVRDSFYWFHDTPGQSSWVRRFCDFYSERGGFEVEYMHSPTTDPIGVQSFRDDAKKQPRFRLGHQPAKSYPALDLPSKNARVLNWAGLAYDAGYFGLRSPPEVWRVQLIFPDWLAMGVLAVPFIYWLGSLKYRRRRKLGQCLACGYDLRATPDRCPECGTSVTTATAR